MSTAVVRWAVAAIVVLAIVALLAYARNDPGVGGRVPDAPGAGAAVASIDALVDAGRRS
ncbi:MAG: hypothetical protein JXP37_01570 [Coriobacteriia bacterium]|nr:hypothetical protein [Coriobacteriia bacterium]